MEEGEAGGEGAGAPGFSPPGADGLGSEEGPRGRAVRGRAGAAGAVGAVPCGGGTSAPLPSPRSPGRRGGEGDGGVGTREGGDGAGGRGWGCGGGDTGGRAGCAALPAAAPPLPVWPSAWLGSSAGGGGWLLGSPRTRPPPSKRSRSGVSGRGSPPPRGRPLCPHAAGGAPFVGLIPGGRRRPRCGAGNSQVAGEAGARPARRASRPGCGGRGGQVSWELNCKMNGEGR